MTFKDLNFKLSVVSALHDLGYYVEEAERISEENEDWDDDHEAIPAVLEFYEQLDVNPAYLKEIEGLYPDGGDLAYQYATIAWDGEDEQFDISSLEGIEYLENLKVFAPSSMITMQGVDYSPLLACKKLEKADVLYIRKDDKADAVIKALHDKGVDVCLSKVELAAVLERCAKQASVGASKEVQSLGNTTVVSPYVKIEDPNFLGFLQTKKFRSALCNEKGQKNGIGPYIDPQAETVLNKTELSIRTPIDPETGNNNNSWIRNLNGIEVFVNVTSLNAQGIGLTSVGALPPKLTHLNLFNNKLEALPVLPQGLKQLNVRANTGIDLSNLPEGLEDLNCSANELESLPQLPSSLLILNCSDNAIAELPALPAGLLELDCSDNQLREKPEHPKAKIDYSGNKITRIKAPKSAARPSLFAGSEDDNFYLKLALVNEQLKVDSQLRHEIQELVTLSNKRIDMMAFGYLIKVHLFITNRNITTLQLASIRELWISRKNEILYLLDPEMEYDVEDYDVVTFDGIEAISDLTALYIENGIDADINWTPLLSLANLRHLYLGAEALAMLEDKQSAYKELKSLIRPYPELKLDTFYNFATYWRDGINYMGYPFSGTVLERFEAAGYPQDFLDWLELGNCNYSSEVITGDIDGFMFNILNSEDIDKANEVVENRLLLENDYLIFATRNGAEFYVFDKQNQNAVYSIVSDDYLEKLPSINDIYEQLSLSSSQAEFIKNPSLKYEDKAETVLRVKSVYIRSYIQSFLFESIKPKYANFMAFLEDKSRIVKNYLDEHK